MVGVAGVDLEAADGDVWSGVRCSDNVTACVSTRMNLTFDGVRIFSSDPKLRGLPIFGSDPELSDLEIFSPDPARW